MSEREAGNDVYPKSFKQKAEMEKHAFQRDVIAGLETAESVIFDVATALAKRPGYEAETQSITAILGQVEDLRADLGGES